MLPVLVAVTVYAIAWPTALKWTAVVFFVTTIPADLAMWIWRVSAACARCSLVAVTVLSRVPPASTPACVTRWLAEQVMLASGASVVAEQVGVPSVLLSESPMPVRVTLPVFVTRYV